MTKAEFDRRVGQHWQAIVDRAERAYAAAQPPTEEPIIVLDVSVQASPAEQLWRSLDPAHGRNPNLGADQPPADGREPDHTREGIFVYHNCYKCQHGAKPCVRGAPNRCDYPHARND